MIQKARQTFKGSILEKPVIKRGTEQLSLPSETYCAGIRKYVTHLQEISNSGLTRSQLDERDLLKLQLDTAAGGKDF